MRPHLAAPLALLLFVTGCGVAAPAPGPGPVEGREAGSGWQRLPDPPLSPRTHPVVAAVDDRVLVVGGTEFLCPPNADCSLPDEPARSDGALVDTATGEWEAISDAPYPVQAAQTAVVGSVVWLLLPCVGSPACDGPAQLLSYDTAADTWEEHAPLPREVRYADLVAVPGGLVAAPTSDERREVADHRFDLASGRWQALPDDRLPRVFDRFVVPDGDRLLAFGSVIPEPDGDYDEPKVAAALDLASGTWTRLPDAPAHGYQAWRIGGEVWLNPHFGNDRLAVLDLRTDTWRTGPQGPDVDDWEGDAAGLLGEGEAVYEYADGWVLDTTSDRWLRVPERDDGGVYDASVTAAGEGLVVVGGQRWEGSDGELVVDTWVWRP
jgi:hypothetical protein